jgi:hypothetical protein
MPLPLVYRRLRFGVFRCAVAAAVVLVATAACAQECGDVDGSGAVRARDALAVLRAAVQGSEELVCSQASDCTGPNTYVAGQVEAAIGIEHTVHLCRGGWHRLSLRASDDGSRVFVSTDSILFELAVPDLSIVRATPLTEEFEQLDDLSSDGSYALLHGLQSAGVVELATGVQRELVGSGAVVNGRTAIAGDAVYLAFGSLPAVRVISIAGERRDPIYPVGADAAFAPLFLTANPSRTRLLVAASDRYEVIDPSAGEAIHTISHDRGAPDDVIFLDESRFIAVRGASVMQFDLGATTAIASIYSPFLEPGDDDYVGDVELSGSGDALVAVRSITVGCRLYEPMLPTEPNDYVLVKQAEIGVIDLATGAVLRGGVVLDEPTSDFRVLDLARAGDTWLLATESGDVHVLTGLEGY